MVEEMEMDGGVGVGADTYNLCTLMCEDERIHCAA